VDGPGELLPRLGNTKFGCIHCCHFWQYCSTYVNPPLTLLAATVEDRDLLRAVCNVGGPSLTLGYQLKECNGAELENAEVKN
jgi:hypothetical protein